MNIIMTLLVRDEMDIIEDFIRYHLAQGIGGIIVTDNRSSDGTMDVVRQYLGSGVVEIIREDQDDYSQSKWVTRMAELARTRHGAEWIINSDCDEFWQPKSGNLETQCLAASRICGVASIQRSDYLPRRVETHSPIAQMIVRKRVSLNTLGQPLPPKVMHGAEPGIIVEQGNHAVVKQSPESTRPWDGILIHHYPMRSRKQMRNKIACGGAAYERNKTLPSSIGLTWRTLYKKIQDGTFDAWYDSLVFMEDSKAQIENGDLLVDRRISMALGRLGVTRG